MEKNEIDSRRRIWLAVIYPESIKQNWEDLLREMCVCTAACLHDRDVWEDDESDHVKGELKKPHIHLVMKFSGSKSFKQVWDILRELQNDPSHCPPPEVPWSDTKACVQYLIHENHPNKTHYLKSEIISICGFDVARYFRLTDEEEEQVFEFILELIETKKIYEYWTLCRYLSLHKLDSDIFQEAFSYVRKHTIACNALLASKRNIEKDINENDKRSTSKL